ncbi:uncharacterized protein TRUGW13939_02448 [Talaromyces rugulosus]|uniref:Rhodopsin domain-containing protein n=1 Tax=Talaromyces rugulosus TaxID=121627 RepID=A0A7H8QNE3_TALRU|nr:uncharacterized protein TRUGW13939_02448 [Talaromyces rugulosus]QKX55356.1 hypothetical protein TRUGW13939_02448 [Talaromyces rugulosus]
MTSLRAPPAVDLSENRGPPMRTLLIAMIVLPTVAVLLRFWSRTLLPATGRLQSVGKFWWDDWSALVAAVSFSRAIERSIRCPNRLQIFNIALCGMGLKMVDLGMGKHSEAVPPGNVNPFLKLLWVQYYIFDTGTSVAKASALFFYVRVFTQSAPRFRYALLVVHAMNAIWLLAILLAVVFECNPIRKAWTPELPGTCISTDKLWLGSGSTSLIIDVIILVIPMPTLWQLQLKTSRRILIIGVFVCAYM